MTKKILLVEDDEVHIQGVHRAFSKMDLSVRVHVVKNGVEGLSWLYERKKAGKLMPHLIIIDINMPKMNGIDFLKALRKDSDFNKARMLVLTTSNNPKDYQETEALAVDGYLMKPVRYQTLYEFCKAIPEFGLNASSV